MNIFDFLSPPSSRDEIIQLSYEVELENCISLSLCCGVVPSRCFCSDTEYFVVCSICGKRTRYFKKPYLAMQAWNKEERR